MREDREKTSKKLKRTLVIDRDTEREIYTIRKQEKEKERDRERERESVCVCVCARACA